MNVAQIIWRQLGGGWLAQMTGARNPVDCGNALMFSLPPSATKDGINKVKITLTPADTYTMEFFKIRGTSVKTVATVEDVYCDQLHSVFTDTTGLYTKI